MQKQFKILLILLFVLAFGLRLAGISYGLPLWLINDEPSTILGALKMMELKSVIPALHQTEMASVLYYPPYISYLYLIPFSIVYGMQHFLFDMPMPAILADLSPYFIVARLISIGAGLLSLWLVFKTSESLFSSRKAAFVSAFLGATSLIHIALSFSARHWIFIALIYALSFYLLFAKKNYAWFSIIAAFGVGVSTISVFLFALLPLHYFFIENKRAISIRKIWPTALVTAFLCILPGILYPQSNGFIVDLTAQSSKSLLGIIASPFYFFSLLISSEPVVVIAAIFGLIMLLKKNKKLSISMIAFIYFYSIVFYIMFRYESRFLLPILPLIYVVGGYGLVSVLKKNSFIAIVLIIPLLAAVRLDYLALINDSRINAVHFVGTTNEKVITFGSQLRIPANPRAIDELENIDTQALRRVDMAEKELSHTNHALNLFTIKNESFLQSLPEYIAKNNYTYFVIEQGNSPMHIYMQKIPQRELLARLGENSVHSIATSEFRGTLYSLFTVPMLGPEIHIFR